jgi:hypothetical protein
LSGSFTKASIIVVKGALQLLQPITAGAKAKVSPTLIVAFKPSMSIKWLVFCYEIVQEGYTPSD